MAGNMAVNGAGSVYGGGNVQDVSRREVGGTRGAPVQTDVAPDAATVAPQDAFDAAPRMDAARMAMLGSPSGVQAADLSGASSPNVAGNWTAATRDGSEQLLRQAQMTEGASGPSGISAADKKQLLDARFKELLRNLGYA